MVMFLAVPYHAYEGAHLDNNANPISNPTGLPVGSVDYYDAVLKEVNKVRQHNSMPPLLTLPRARGHRSYRHCAVGVAFDDYKTAVSACASPLIKHYERSFEGGYLPEIEPA